MQNFVVRSQWYFYTLTADYQKEKLEDLIPLTITSERITLTRGEGPIFGN